DALPVVVLGVLLEPEFVSACEPLGEDVPGDQVEAGEPAGGLRTGEEDVGLRVVRVFVALVMHGFCSWGKVDCAGDWRSPTQSVLGEDGRLPQNACVRTTRSEASSSSRGYGRRTACPSSDPSGPSRRRRRSAAPGRRAARTG